MFQESKYLYLFLPTSSRISLLAHNNIKDLSLFLFLSSSSFLPHAHLIPILTIFRRFWLRRFYSMHVENLFFWLFYFHLTVVAGVSFFHSFRIRRLSRRLQLLVFVELHTYVYLLLHIFCASPNNAIPLLYCLLLRIVFSLSPFFSTFTLSKFHFYSPLSYFFAWHFSSQHRRRHIFTAYTKINTYNACRVRHTCPIRFAIFLEK